MTRAAPARVGLRSLAACAAAQLCQRPPASACVRAEAVGTMTCARIETSSHETVPFLLERGRTSPPADRRRAFFDNESSRPEGAVAAGMEPQSQQHNFDLEESRRLRSALQTTHDETAEAQRALLDAYREMLDGTGPGPTSAHMERVDAATAASRLALAQCNEYLDEMSNAELRRAAKRNATTPSARLRLWVAIA